MRGGKKWPPEAGCIVYTDRMSVLSEEGWTYPEICRATSVFWCVLRVNRPTTGFGFKLRPEQSTFSVPVLRKELAGTKAVSKNTWYTRELYD